MEFRFLFPRFGLGPRFLAAVNAFILFLVDSFGDLAGAFLGNCGSLAFSFGRELSPCSLEPSPYKLFRSSMFLLIEVTFFLNFGRFTLKKMECSKQAFFFRN